MAPLPTGSSSMRMHDPENIVGRAIGGRYLVRRCISQGGMGVIYLARQEALDRDVVLKVVRSDRADEEGVARFRREARSLSVLSHPNVVQIFDHGIDQDTGLCFIVMEYVRGITLAKYRKQRGILPTEEFLPIATQILEGVADAHRNGLVHRDLKPSNVMLTSVDGVRLCAKILDFGLSKVAGGKEHVTQANSFVGSIMYMAPEVIRNRDSDARADVYSLGVTFYQLLSGRNPASGDDPYQVLLQQANSTLTPLGKALPEGHNVPAALVELIDRCMAHAPQHRPRDAWAVLEELQSALSDVVPSVMDVAQTAVSAQDSIPEWSGVRSGSSMMVSRRSNSTALRGAAGPSTRAVLWLVVGIGAVVALSMLTITGLLAVVLNALVLMPEQTTPVAETEAVVPDDLGVASVLRERALRALREGDYDRAVALTTEAVEVAPDESDLKELLTIVTDLRSRKLAAANVAPVPAPVPDPEPVAAPPAPEHRSPAVRPPLPRRPPPRPSPPPAASTPVGIAVITSSPKGVSFEIPGVVKGTTPFRALDVPEGAHDVLFYMDGRVVHSARLNIQRDGLELLDVELPAAAAVAVREVARPEAVPPAAEARAAEGRWKVYVYVPGSIKPRVIEDALRAGWSGVDVTAYGSYRELEQAIGTARPTAVIAPRSVLEAMRLPIHLHGCNASGSTTEQYLLLGKKRFSPAEIGSAVIGTVDVAGRESSAEFVAKLLKTPTVPQIKRVAEEGDLLPLLQFGTADAILLPESAARTLMGSTQMELIETNVASGAGLAALSVLDERNRGGVEAAVLGLGGSANAKVGVASWER